MPLTIDESCCRREILTVHSLPWKDESDSHWVRIKTVMVSGAAESVAPPSMAPGVSIEESPVSKSGQLDVSASKERLPNMGQQRMPVMTNKGMDTRVLYQIAEVR